MKCPSVYFFIADINKLIQSSQQELFSTAPFLAWLPDETLFSLIGRHRQLWGHSNASRTSDQFFGRGQLGTHQDLPSNLGEFVLRTEGIFGAPNELALEHTMLKYYAAFLQPLDVENAIACMVGTNVSDLKIRLGIQSSRFRAHHPLKACEACISEDIEFHGWAYWHLDHQYPGVWMCVKHRSFLRESIQKSSSVDRYQWLLPSIESLRQISDESVKAFQNDHTALLDFSSYVVRYIELARKTSIDVYLLYKVLREQLKQQDLITDSNRLRLTELAGRYLQHVSGIRLIPEMRAFPSTLDGAIVDLKRLLKLPRTGKHPLRYLSVISWIFPDQNAFWVAYLEASKLEIQNASMHISEESNFDGSKQESMLIKTVSQYTKIIGVEVSSDALPKRSIANRVIQPPRKLTSELLKVVQQELAQGGDKQQVADLIGVSIKTIYRILQSDEALNAAWSRAHQEHQLTAARSEWLALTQQHVGLGIEFVRMLDVRLYTWLYRNDRAWFDLNKPTPPKVKSNHGKPRIEWDKRDLELSTIVKECVLEIQQQNEHKRVKLWQLFQALPELKAKYSALPRLPLTQQAIHDGVRVKSRALDPNLFS